jgi:aryl sulfotransferase
MTVRETGLRAMKDGPWPRKLRELRNHTLDSTRWNDFAFRDDDIVIGSWAKSGTTWVQQIIFQLLANGAETTYSYDRALWVEQRSVPQPILAFFAARPGRRVLKTHLPVDSLVFCPRAKYLYIGRDGRDVLWSWYNHHQNMTPAVYDMLNTTPGLEGEPLGKPAEDIRTYFHEWLDKDGFPLWPFWSHVQSWWDVRDLPNVLLVHFNGLKKDMPGEIRRIAHFLGLSLDAESWPRILEHCSFEYMRDNAARLSRTFQTAFLGGGGTFMHRGTNGRWATVLSSADIEKYEHAATTRLSPDCASWLATGEAQRTDRPRQITTH